MGERTEKLLQEMGMRIAARRKELNMTQADLAEAVGVTTQTISSAECGRKALRSENIVKICTALNCTSDYLLFGGALTAIPGELAKTFEHLSPFQFQCLARIIENYLRALSSEND